jgi:UDP:flavonoid glycosyltransferase YjiC (YdhE family)
VLLSLSTFGFPGQEAVLQRLIDATAGLGARVVVTTGPVVDPARLRRRADVEVHRWLPHAEVMPQMTAMAGHGGHGSTTAALAHDLPLLVLPMDPLTDQPMMGRAVEAAGAGRRLHRKASVADIRDALAALIADGPHRAAAARLGASIRARDAVAEGADALEAVLREGASAAPARGRRAARR